MSQFIEMFGDTHVKSDNSRQWKEVVEIINGKDYKTIQVEDGGYPVYGTGGEMARAADYLSPANSILLGRKGTIDKPLLIKEKYWNVDTAFGAVPDENILNYVYFYWHCKTIDFNILNKGTTLPSTTKVDLLNLWVKIPAMEEQNRFASIVEQADKSGFVGFKSQFIEMFGCLAERVALSSLCDTFIDGDWIEAKDQSGSGIRLIQTGNVGVGTFKDKGDRARYISEETFNRLNCTEVVEGDILISRLPEPVGRACIIPAGLGKSITAVDCTIIRLNDKVLPKFFVAFTNTPDYAMQIKKVLSGTTRLRVSRANLGKIQVPLPSIDKQQQFVTIAEQADKSGFVGFKSQFIEMFGIAEATKPLADFVEVSFPGEWGQEDKDGSGVKVIRTTNFTNNGKLDLSEVVTRDIDSAKIEKKKLFKGDIILERSGGTNDNPVGRVVYFEEDGVYLFNNFTQLLRCKEGVNSLFIFYSLFNYYQMNKNVIRSMGNKTTGIQNLKMDRYWQIPIADVSIELQKEFESIYRQADKSGFELRKSIDAIDAVIKSLINS